MSQQTNRITVERLKELYAKLGVRPMTAHWLFFSYESMCLTDACPLSALYVDDVLKADLTCRPDIFSIANWSEDTFGYDYKSGFLHGVTSKDSDCPHEPVDRYRLGVWDGMMVRRAINSGQILGMFRVKERSELCLSTGG